MTEKRLITTAGKPAQTLAEIAANVAALQADLAAQGCGPRDLKAELAEARRRVEELEKDQADSIHLVAEQTRRIVGLERENAHLTRAIAIHAAENHGLRTQTQVYFLEIEELRAALLGLVTGLAGLPENWIVQYETDRRLQRHIDVARECMGRAGLLSEAQ